MVNYEQGNSQRLPRSKTCFCIVWYNSLHISPERPACNIRAVEWITDEMERLRCRDTRKGHRSAIGSIGCSGAVSRDRDKRNQEKCRIKASSTLKTKAVTSSRLAISFFYTVRCYPYNTAVLVCTVTIIFET